MRAADKNARRFALALECRATPRSCPDHAVVSDFLAVL